MAAPRDVANPVWPDQTALFVAADNIHLLADIYRFYSMKSFSDSCVDRLFSSPLQEHSVETLCSTMLSRSLEPVTAGKSGFCLFDIFQCTCLLTLSVAS